MPLFEHDVMKDAWLTWTPTFSCSGTMTIASTAIQAARYKVVGKTCFMELAFTGTLGEADAATIYATLPAGVSGKDGAVFFLAQAIDGDGSAHAAAVLIQTTGQGGKLAFYKDGVATSWQQGASFQGYLSATFETA